MDSLMNMMKNPGGSLGGREKKAFGMLQSIIYLSLYIEQMQWLHLPNEKYR